MKADFESFGLEIYGESHSEKIGVKMSGLPAGFDVDYSEIEKALARRKSGNNVWSTPRKEDDAVHILSGVENGKTTGGVFEAAVFNDNVRPQDYKNISYVPRPSHADFAAFAKDGYISSGGGRFSGRMTAPLVIAGSLAEQILKKNGIEICAYVSEIGGVNAGSYSDNKIKESDFERLKKAELPLIDEGKAEDIKEKISDASAKRDSLGGIVECIVTGLKAGEIGNAMFEGLEGKIAYSVFGVPAVKGVEFGEGFGLSKMKGSEANDAFVLKQSGKTRAEGQNVCENVVTATNFSGGINGGISNGMPVTLRVAIRPTPSIGIPQKSVNLETGENVNVEIKGRHDACIVPRAAVCIESAVALAVFDEMMKYGKLCLRR